MMDGNMVEVLSPGDMYHSLSDPDEYYGVIVEAATIFAECECNNTEIREYTFSNGSTHHIKQCCNCGRKVGSPIKKQPGSLVEASDESFEESMRSAHQIYRLHIFSSYDEYLETEHWSSLRERILQRDNHKCTGCGDEARAVHHLTYIRLGCERDSDLTSLCHFCHAAVHGKNK